MDNRIKYFIPRISNRLLVYNTFYNLLGNILPLLAGLISIPIMIHKMGVDRFGILALVWMIVGYFSIFDLGMGRATTKFVAEYLSLDKLADLPRLIWTSVISVSALGLAGGIALAFVTPWLVERTFNIPPELWGETKKAFYVMAVGIPFVLSTTCLNGILEAQQRFGLINAIRTPASILNYVAPLPVLLFSQSLYLITAMLVISRFLVWLAFSYFIFRDFLDVRFPSKPSLEHLKQLWRFGGWLTVSNLVGPIIVYMDRFLIGSLLTMQAVAYYIIPYELVTKLWIIPASLTPVLFPVFSAYASEQEPKLAALHQRAVKYIFLILAPFIIGVLVFAQPFLSFWISPEFGAESTLLMQLLALGVLVNALAWVPVSAIEAMNRPDLPAKLHLLELPVFLGILWLSLKIMGLIGAALVWVLRVSIDAGLLFWLMHYLMPSKATHYGEFGRGCILNIIILTAAVLFSIMIPSLTVKLVLLPAIVIGYAWLSWKYLLDVSEKEILLSRINLDKSSK
ncbi:MAG: flippase [Deltaproteobacteria bacterium]|nr:flippase [Deltaproteobacteria bacterium]